MTSEIHARDEQLCAAITSSREVINGLATSKKLELDLARLESDLHPESGDLANILTAFRLELHHQSPKDKRDYKQKQKKHRQDIDELRTKFEWAKAEVVRDDMRNQLMSGHVPAAVDRSSAQGLMNHGKNVLQDSKESLQRTVAKVAETLQSGKDTVVMLDVQTEQILKNNDKLDEMEAKIQQSSTVIREMARRVATDKYMWVLVCLVAAAVAFLVYWKYKH